MPERLYSTAEAAEYLGLKVETIKYHLYPVSYTHLTLPTTPYV